MRVTVGAKFFHEFQGTELDSAHVSLDVVEQKGQDLYSLMKLKFNVKCSAVCKDIVDRNGLEVYRRLTAEYDLFAEGTDMALLDQLMNMGKAVYKNFDETHLAIDTFKILVDEYNKLTPGPPLEERNKVC